MRYFTILFDILFSYFVTCDGQKKKQTFNNETARTLSTISRD